MFSLKKWLCLIWCVFLCLVAPFATSGDLEKGIALSKEKRYGEAFPLIEKEARQGDAKAQFYLGKMYDFGEGTKKDLKKAIYWYRQGASQGNPKAMYNLAYLYAYGEGVEKDLKKAVELYSQAAKKGLPMAQYNLSLMYVDGKGVEQNYDKAFEWAYKAAVQGHQKAQYNVGYSYSAGEGVKQDYAKALEWYHKAADHGSVKALHAIGVAYQFGEGVPVDRGEAAKWYEKAAEQNYLPSIQNLGALYMADGDGLSEDWDKTYYWSQKGLELGDKGISALRLGIIYFSGHGSHPVDNAKATYYFNLAGENGRADAWYWLGTMQEYGFGGKPDMDKAMAYYRRSADEGFKPAEKRLEQKDPSWTVRFFWWARKVLGAD